MRQKSQPSRRQPRGYFLGVTPGLGVSVLPRGVVVALGSVVKLLQVVHGPQSQLAQQGSQGLRIRPLQGFGNLFQGIGFRLLGGSRGIGLDFLGFGH